MWRKQIYDFAGLNKLDPNKYQKEYRKINWITKNLEWFNKDDLIYIWENKYL